MKHQIDPKISRPFHNQLLLTTQPGWAFASLTELRNMGFNGHATFHHRESSVIACQTPNSTSKKLVTPASVYGCVTVTRKSKHGDSTTTLKNLLKPRVFRENILAWLPLVDSKSRRSYSLQTESWGKTSLQRKELSSLVANIAQTAFPRWKRSLESGLRIYCKADPENTVVGVQLYSNLQKGGSRPGTLRRHLACCLLAITNVSSDTLVFDPFMGTGTILDAAKKEFNVSNYIGLEIDKQIFETVNKRLGSKDGMLLNKSFEEFDFEHLGKNPALVSNIPFGVQFQKVRTEKLRDFLHNSGINPSQITILMGREQANELSQSMGLQKKNVLILGQAASIIYKPQTQVVDPTIAE